jgi:nuclear-control-of-ATPase protein 2
MPDVNGVSDHLQSHYAQQAMKQQQHRVDRSNQIHWGRALDLDAEDRSYQAYGGVERVRRRLGLTALMHEISQDEEVMDIDDDALCPSKALVDAAIEALQVSCPPSGSLSGFVQSMLGPLAKAEYWVWEQRMNEATGKSNINATTSDNEKLLSVVRLAVKTAEIRALDALLRCVRDRLLRTSYRLRQTERHWRRRVKIAQSTGPFFQRLLRDSIEGDRIHLAYARAAYMAEVSRLGTIQKILMERPPELSDSNLLKALQKTARKKPKPESDFNKNDNLPKKRWMMPLLSKYTVRFSPEGKGQLKLRIYDSDASIDSQIAKEVLLSSHNGVRGVEVWTEGVHKWTEKSRKLICGVIKECLDDSVSPSDEELRRYRDVEQHWSAYNYFNDTGAGEARDSSLMMPDQIRAQWEDLLQLVDNLKKFRRLGEGKMVGAAIVSRIRRLDVLGLPSSLIAVGIAQIVHHFLAPRWRDIQYMVMNISVAVSSFLYQRFWQPFSGIAQDVFATKKSSLLDAFDLPNEETSLDNMLRDLGFGDGSIESRKEAIQRATRQYEDDLRLGLVGNLFKGRLLRLLLMQVQQLKTGLLHAMSNIDTLLQGNRLNVQLLATIPAILIITMGTRFFMRSWYHFRSKDLRPLSTVHGDMFETLDDMERILLLADRSSANHVEETHRYAPPTQVLKDTELGEFILNMHSYLVLLDFSCPPIPSRLCDAIHRLLQDTLGSAGSIQRLDIDRQIELLKLIKMKHKDLLHHI